MSYIFLLIEASPFYSICPLLFALGWIVRPAWGSASKPYNVESTQKYAPVPLHKCEWFQVT